MGFRFRRSINLGGGFKINLSKSGIGYSWGTKGYRISRTARGTTRRTYSIPGTGISYVMEGKNIVLTKESNIAREEVKQQNTITVKGVVTDMQGEAIIGANIHKGK